MQTFNARSKLIRLNAEENQFVLSFDPLAKHHRLIPRKVGDNLFVVPTHVLSDPLPFVMPTELGDFLRSKPLIELTTLHYGEEFLGDLLPSDAAELLIPSRRYEPTGARYDRPLKPLEGDQVQLMLLAHVALAMTAWAHLEASLAWLFGSLVGAKSGSSGVLTSFGMVTTHSVRINMIEAAMVAVAVETAMPEEEAEFKALKRDMKPLADRRNEIAHGCVRIYNDNGVAIQPPEYPTRQMTFIDGTPIPAYAYTSAEVAFFVEEFRSTTLRVYELAQKIRERMSKS